MPTGFHPHAHLYSLGRQFAVELLRFFAVLQSSLGVVSEWNRNELADPVTLLQLLSARRKSENLEHKVEHNNCRMTGPESDSEALSPTVSP
jgi:hypothetical protein